jgi:Polyketide cyclase / dehydrase and lipid transport
MGDMAQVNVTAEKTVHGSVNQVRAALADYRSVRPQLLTDHYRDYQLRSGGQGAGSEVAWKLAATEKRVRDQLIEVSESGTRERPALVESDRNSSMVTTWTVRAAENGPAGITQSTVEVHTSWNGAGGIGGFFERTFAPAGLRKIYDGVLTNLDTHLRTTPPA